MRRLLRIGLVGGILFWCGVRAASAQASFTDDPLAAATTPIKAVHITELRTRIDTLRQQVGLGPFAWTDPTLTPGATHAKAVHLLDLRTAISEAYTAARWGAPTFQSAISPGTRIMAAHVTELRTLTKTFEASASALAAVVARVVVTPAPAIVAFRGTASLTATGYNWQNVVVPNVTFSWTSSDATVVAIAGSSGSSATVSGVGSGSATISAIPAQGPAGSAQVAVDTGTILVLDSFSGVNGTNLAAHRPEVTPLGRAWATSGTPAIVLGGQQATTSDGADARAIIDAGVADGVARVSWTPHGAVWAGLILRASDANNYLLAEFASNSVYLSKWVGGQFSSQLGSAYLTAPGESVHRFEVHLSGATIDVRYDNSDLFTVSEAFNVTATGYGLRWLNQYSNDAPVTFDDFEIDGTPPPLVARVVVSPSPTTVPFGGTQFLTAQAYDGTNTLLSGVAFSWSSSNPTAAPVAGTGTDTASVSGAATGDVTITARPLRGVAGTAAVHIDPGTVLVADTFTGTDNSLLSNHTPNVSQIGAGWVTSGSPNVVIRGGQAATDVGTDAMALIDAGASDGDLRVDWTPGANGYWGGLAFRATDVNNYLVASYGINGVYLSQVTNGVWVSLGLASLGYPSNQPHRLEVRLAGAAIDVWWDGACVIEAVDAFNATATKHGLRWWNQYSGGAEPTFDNFAITGALPPAVHHATVTASSDAVPFGGTVSVTAEAYDSSNVAIPNVSFAWTSSNPFAATVQGASGNSAVVTGRGNGSATIAAIPIRGNGGSTAVTVDPGRVLVHDSFTDLDGTSLSSHIPEIRPAGAVWVTPGSSPRTIQGQQAAVGAGADALALIDAGAADGAVRFAWTPHDGLWTGLIFRATDSTHYLLAEFATNGVYLFKVNGSTTTWLNTASLPLPGSVTHRLEVRLAGSALEIWWDGVRILEQTETFNQAATQYGLHWFNQYTGGETSTIDDFEVRTLPVVDHVTVSPATVSMYPATPQTVTAQARDDHDQPVADVSYHWSVDDPSAVLLAPTSDTATTIIAGVDRGHHTSVRARAFGSTAVGVVDTWITDPSVLTLCTITLAGPSVWSVPAQGGAPNGLTFTATPAGCYWSADNGGYFWARPNYKEGNGGGAQGFVIDGNPNTSPRTATITMNNVTVTIHQEAGPFSTGSGGGGSGGGGTFNNHVLQTGESLGLGDSRTSANGLYRVVYQGDDGNLVLTRLRDGQPIWASMVQRVMGTVTMQTDGNLVVSDGTQSVTINDKPSMSQAWLDLQDDGNLLIKAPNSVPLWDTHTVDNPGPNGPGDCSVSLSPLSMQASGLGLVVVSTSEGCTWTATADVPWLTVSPANGTSSDLLSIVIDVWSPDSHRIGHIAIANSQINIRRPASVMRALGIDGDGDPTDWQCGEEIVPLPWDDSDPGYVNFVCPPVYGTYPNPPVDPVHKPHLHNLALDTSGHLTGNVTVEAAVEGQVGDVVINVTDGLRPYAYLTTIPNVHQGQPYPFDGNVVPRPTGQIFVQAAWLGTYDAQSVQAPSVEVQLIPPSANVTRGESVTLAVSPAQIVETWYFVPDDNHFDRITRTTDTSSSNWSGDMAVSGTVHAIVPNHPELTAHITVDPRPSFVSTPVPATLRDPGWVTPSGYVLEPTNPKTGAEGSGVTRIEFSPHLQESDIRTIDGGPNDQMKIVISLDEATTVDWAVHPDVSDQQSAWWLAQIGTWNSPNAVCRQFAGYLDGEAGIIRATDYEHGVKRHEAGTPATEGTLNSHFDIYKQALVSRNHGS